MLNGITTASEFSGQELTTACSATLPSLATFVTSSSPVPLNSTEDLSTWLQAAFPVSHSQQPAPCLEPTTPETCGQRPLNVCASYDHSMRSWKTFQPSLIADISSEYLETWPKWGWMQSGVCFRLAPLVRHIHGKGCSYWPTPTAADYKMGFNNLIEAKRATSKERRASGYIMQRRIPYDYLVRYGEPVMTTFYEWLMGIPIGATELKPLAMGKFHQWLQQHGIR